MPPKFQITVQGHLRSVQIEAIVDTGFAGALCLPMDIANWIGAQIANWGDIRLADGTERRIPAVYCQVELLNRTSIVVALVTKEYGEPIIGTELLEGCQLAIDFDTGSVQLKRK
jgi:clan AA aspartic protease